MTISYAGLELLPELLRRGRLIRLWRTVAQLMAKSGMRPRSALVTAFGPFMPAWFWQWANEIVASRKRDILNYTAIRAECLAKLDLAARARESDLDLLYRPWRDGFAMRLWSITRGDPGNGHKGTLAGWGIDRRDPTADKRLVEYCLSVPTEEFLADGVTRSLARRALADRLPAAVLNEPRRGYQAVDWHEALTASRAEIATELDRLGDCASAATALDLPRLKRMVENWPTSGWERMDVVRPYRYALTRGLGIGHFLLKTSGANH
jgi:asparagine synthase (glutamine-hydrolysing)